VAWPLVRSAPACGHCTWVRLVLSSWPLKTKHLGRAYCGPSGHSAVALVVAAGHCAGAVAGTANRQAVDSREWLALRAA
jgi:hypothetical protein